MKARTRFSNSDESLDHGSASDAGSTPPTHQNLNTPKDPKIPEPFDALQLTKVMLADWRSWLPGMRNGQRPADWKRGAHVKTGASPCCLRRRSILIDAHPWSLFTRGGPVQGSPPAEMVDGSYEERTLKGDFQS